MCYTVAELRILAVGNLGMKKDFPRTVVGGVSLPRMIIGCNWVSGFSHRSASGDLRIRSHHHEPDSVVRVFEAFWECIDVRSSLSQTDLIRGAAKNG